MSYYTALRQEAKAHGAAQPLFMNPGVVFDKWLLQRVRLLHFSSSSHPSSHDELSPSDAQGL